MRGPYAVNALAALSGWHLHEKTPLHPSAGEHLSIPPENTGCRQGHVSEIVQLRSVPLAFFDFGDFVVVPREVEGQGESVDRRVAQVEIEALTLVAFSSFVVFCSGFFFFFVRQQAAFLFPTPNFEKNAETPQVL